MPFGRSGTMDLLQLKEVSLTQRLSSLIPGALVSLSLVYWMHKQLLPFTEPNAEFFAYKPAPTLSGNCLKEYWALHKTMLILLISLVGNFVLQIVTHFKPCGWTLVIIVGVGEFVLTTINCGISFYGIIIVGFNWNYADIDHCKDLHNLAWWLYIGVWIIAVCFVFCLVFGMSRIVAAKLKPSDASEGRKALLEE